MIGAFSFCLFIPLPRLLSLSAYKITTFLQLTSSQFILTHPNSSILIQTNPNLTQKSQKSQKYSSSGLFNLTQKSQKSQKYSSSGLYNCPAEPMEQREQNHVLHGLCRVATEEDESQMKEIKEIFLFALCAQPVPKALSVISVNFCVPSILCAQPVPEALSFISFISAGLKNLCDLCNLCAITPCHFTP